MADNEKILQLRLRGNDIVTLVDVGTAVGMAVQDETSSAVVRLEPADTARLREWLNGRAER